MIKAVIFDMDGTMVNTEALWFDVNKKLAENHGVKFEDKIRIQMMGKKDSECLQVFKDYYHLDTLVEDLIKERRAILLADISMVQINRGLIELLDLLDTLKLKKAVATASFTEFAYKIFENFSLTSRFDAIVTGDEVKFSKPNPELFLEAARRIEVLPQDCLVLEDAQNGIEAAHNAGMRSIALPHEHSADHDFSKATKILNSMLEVNQALLESF